MTNHANRELKRQLRARVRAIPVNPARHNARILGLIRHWLEHHRDHTHIAVYHPLPDEPDLLPLIGLLPGRTWYFPRIAGDGMTFHPVSSPASEMAPGEFGIPEPIPSIPPAAPEIIQVFLCPGLAFENQTGCRLGRGKGYYDRYLAHTRKDTLRAGVCFPERIVGNTFAEAHDIRMDLVFC